MQMTGFSLGHLHMGGFVPPPIWGTSAGGQSINGGLMRGDINLMGGPNFDRLYHKLKVLLLLSWPITRCNLSATILLKLINSYLIAFKFTK